MGAIALAALIADYRFGVLDPLKSTLMSITEPVFTAINIPSYLSDWFSESVQSRESLVIENARLSAENLVLKAKAQRLAALTIENVRLRELLNSTSLLEENVLVAEIIGVSPDPQSQFVILNKGSNDGVFESQAVVDASGLFGQVTEVSADTSRVTLISDQRHAVPVQVDRNGLRMILEGSGELGEVNLPFVSATTDIKEGDILSTSGLGGVFPLGYPVARITEIQYDPGQAFAAIKARPLAHLERARHVLLLFNEADDISVTPADAGGSIE